MSNTIEFLSFLAGELLGDATFFFLGMRKYGTIAEANEEKRRQYYITKRSMFMVMCSCLPGGLVKFIFQKFTEVINNLDGIWADVVEFVGALNSFASIAVFMFFYRGIRKRLIKRYQEYHADQWETTVDPWGIYVWDEMSGNYLLSEKWIYIKDCTRYLLVVNLFLLAGLHFIPFIRDMSGNILKFDVMEVIPIAAMTILMECYNYLSIDDRSFFKGKKKAAEEFSLDLVRLRVNYEERNLPGLSVPLKMEHHENRIEDAMQEYMEKLSVDADPYIQYFTNYLKKRRCSVKRHYHTGCLETTVRLIKGENLFCASPFYKDIDICIFFPAFLALLKGKKVLVLAEDCGGLEDLRKWVKEGIEEVQSLDDFWQVRILQEIEDDTDVGILSFQNIYRPEEFRWLDKFFKEVGFVVIIEASGMLAGGQEAISNLSGLIGKESEECSWLLCDNNAESMLDLFSHLLNERFSYVSATPLPAEEYLIGFWDVEKEQIQPWDPVRHYLGAEIQAAEVAWFNDVKQVSLFGEEIVPIYDMKWIVGQYYQEFHKRTGKKPHQYIMDDGISMKISGEACKMEEECFLIVEDCNFNLFEAARQYATRGSKKAVIHILSPNYMLRNFMKGKEGSMRADPKFLAQFVPEYVKTKRNIAVHLIRKMLCKPVAETEMKEALEKSESWGQKFRGLEDVRELVKLIVPSENPEEGDFVISYASRFDKNMGTTVQEKYYQLNSTSIKREFVRYFQKACFLNENGEKCHINKLILAGHLDQKYLKGQMVVLNGLYYEIIKRRITDYEYILQVRRASEQFSERRYYRQNRCYEVTNIINHSYIPIDCHVENLSVNSYTADITVRTFGYYACKGWNEIADAAYIVLGQDDVCPRNYISKQFLRVTVTAESQSEAECVAVQMACLFQESFCTFYPQQYHLLSAALDRNRYLDEKEDVLKGVLADIQIENQDQEKEASFYIIEDSTEDMGLLRSIERNFRRIQTLLSEYMQWSKDTGDTYLLFGRKATDVVGGKGD